MLCWDRLVNLTQTRDTEDFKAANMHHSEELSPAVLHEILWPSMLTEDQLIKSKRREHCKKTQESCFLSRKVASPTLPCWRRALQYDSCRLVLRSMSLLSRTLSGSCTHCRIGTYLGRSIIMGDSVSLHCRILRCKKGFWTLNSRFEMLLVIHLYCQTDCRWWVVLELAGKRKKKP